MSSSHAGQRIITLIALNGSFLDALLHYSKAVLLGGAKMQGDASYARALRLRTLDFFIAYAQLVHKQPAKQCDAGSGFETGVPCMPLQDLSAMLSTVNIAAPTPAIPPLAPIGLHVGGNDVLLGDERGMVAGGAACAVGDLSLFETSSMTDGQRSRRPLTRSQALQVYLFCLPLLVPLLA